jgi:hypothetical protein
MRLHPSAAACAILLALQSLAADEADVAALAAVEWNIDGVNRRAFQPGEATGASRSPYRQTAMSALRQDGRVATVSGGAGRSQANRSMFPPLFSASRLFQRPMAMLGLLPPGLNLLQHREVIGHLQRPGVAKPEGFGSEFNRVFTGRKRSDQEVDAVVHGRSVGPWLREAIRRKDVVRR